MSVIGDRAAAALLRGQAAAEALMLDTFAAYAPSGRVIKANGMEGPGYALQYSTPGKTSGRPRAFESNDTRTRFVKVGGTARTVVVGGLHIPISAGLPVAGDFGVGWEFQCTAIAPTTDPEALGRRFLCVGVSVRTFATARRLDVVLLP